MKEQFLKPKINEARKRTKADVEQIIYSIPSGTENLGVGKTYLIQTYGCQGNEADTEKIRGLLESIGFLSTDDERIADLIILNTCAIRANAENKVFGELGRMKPLKLLKKDLLIAVGGCMPQEEVVVEKILKTYHQVDIVFGTHNLHRLLEMIKKVTDDQQKVIDVESIEGDIIEEVPTVHQHTFKAWVNIMYGCDEFCTYCIVPYTRGKERSRQPEAILKEVKDLIDSGYQEITLLGQNVNSYGLDFHHRDYHFSNLLNDLSQLRIPRIRFTTSHPKDFSDDLIAVLSKGGNLMPFIHLPVQSGSDKILKAMNRKYTHAHYLELIAKIRKAIVGVSITTDIIVGFPGETEEDFLATLDLVEKCQFEGAYTFIYSPRTGTPAASYVDDIPKDIKKQRLYLLNDAINKGFAAGNHRFVGLHVKVLVDGPSKTKPEILTGYTEHNKLVNFQGSSDLKGQIVQVKITEARTWSLIGEIVHE
jgi:tRNA-2-methylthio-N6-dimethylallyladenosine synthase